MADPASRPSLDHSDGNGAGVWQALSSLPISGLDRLLLRSVCRASRAWFDIGEVTKVGKNHSVANELCGANFGGKTESNTLDCYVDAIFVKKNIPNVARRVTLAGHGQLVMWFMKRRAKEDEMVRFQEASIFLCCAMARSGQVELLLYFRERGLEMNLEFVAMAARKWNAVEVLLVLPLLAPDAPLQLVA
jgi:hypothetical protein